MVSLTTALQTATAGMNVSQLGLSTTAHNLSNANTDGYSRQQVQFSTVSYNGFGAGVQLETIQRFTDRFLEARALSHEADYGYNSTKSSFLSTLEGIFTASGSSGSLDSQLTNFFNSLTNLSSSPDSTAQRTVMLQSATLLTDTFRNMSTDLSDTAREVDDQIDAEVSTINTILSSIYTLNGEIAAVSLSGVNGSNANDLLDERQRQLDALSERFKLSITTSTSNGGLRITTENGRTLVHEGGYVQMERTSGSPYEGIGYRSVNVNGDLSSTLVTINTDTLTSGKIKALIDVRDDVIGDLTAELELLSDTIRTEFNKIHSRGTTYPAQNSLTSGNTSGVTNLTSDLFTELSADLAGDTFHVSVVDASGAPVYTTVGNGGAITIPGAGPFSLTDLQDLINNNADVGVTALGVGLGVTATATTDSSGNPIIQMAATNSNYKIVLSNAAESATNDPLGVLGMNNFFTGTGAGDMNIRSDIKADAGLIATGRMRTTDGGLSSKDNQNALAMAGLSTTDVTFTAAGNLPAQSESLTGYAIRITADLALTIADSNARTDFSTAMKDEVNAQIASMSGVSMDEELAQMLIYQNSFQASARLLSTIDELLRFLMQNL